MDMSYLEVSGMERFCVAFLLMSIIMEPVVTRSLWKRDEKKCKYREPPKPYLESDASETARRTAQNVHGKPPVGSDVTGQCTGLYKIVNDVFMYHHIITGH
ncbi:hypothetical protein ANCCEY_02897 [Ancylostoma ceylanicum]|uniref:Uncharacterized protein n=1 Tax=Ancylostoma ceylanicum TaxID=53326 RepID=A0A0D6M3I3_9BILA|nr:hypothetical protein ANCCEY_02897 [Ancylostoma ceylanicum]